MIPTANSDWSIRIQHSQVLGFTHQCFATASQGISGKVLQVPGEPPVADVRLVTGWKDTRDMAEQEIEALIAKHEAGIS